MQSTLTTPSTGTAGPLRAFVAGHPITSYLVASFVIGWAVLFPALAAGLPAVAALPVLALLAQLLPAVLVTAATDGRSGVRALFARVFRWRVHPGWYAVAIFALPAATLLFATVVAGTAPLRAVVERPTLIVGYLASLLMLPLINLWEEAGWMGFVQARLQDRFEGRFGDRGPLAAAAVTAPLFGLIHLPLLLAGRSVAAGLLLVAALAVLAVPFRILLGWLFNSTNSSILVAGLFHAAYNGTTSSGIVDPDALGLDAFVFAGLVTAVLAVWLAWRTRGRLGLPRRGDG
jgi:membrane protease YdiL (CAAX protease family)